MSKKYKIVMSGDIPLCNSGVGLQFRYIVDHLVKTGKYEIAVLGGAQSHASMKPIRTQEWGDAVTIHPVVGYAPPTDVRIILDLFKPDLFWIVTDPRFYTHLFHMSDELRQICPLFYWHLWDNADDLTWPRFNKPYYDACDKIAAINKLTFEFLSKNGWADKTVYIPHGVPEEDFKPLPPEVKKLLVPSFLGEQHANAKFIVFYNSRNAIRKRTGSCMLAFKEFRDMLPEADRDKVLLVMKSPIHDPEGIPLDLVANHFGLSKNVAFADAQFDNVKMNEFYNMADATLSLSSEEGFGLSILESLMVGTPVVCTRTGGMQDTIIDSDQNKTFGIALEPDVRNLIGGQATPYIWSDHVAIQTAAKALLEIYNRKIEHGDHREYYAGEAARASMIKRFHLPAIQEKMEQEMEKTIIEFKQKKLTRVPRVVEI